MQRKKGSNWIEIIIKMVNEFKLTLVHFARPNPMQICACAWIYRWTKRLWKIRTGQPGRGAVAGRGPWAVGRGPWAVGRGPWAVGRGPLGRGRACFLAKPGFHDPHEPIQMCYTDCGFRPSKTQLGDGVSKVSF